MLSILMSLSSGFLSYVAGSAFNLHTYVGIFLGASLSPLWVKLGTVIKAWIVAKFPGSKPVINAVTDVTNQVVTDVTPVVTDVTNVVDPSKNTTSTK